MSRVFTIKREQTIPRDRKDVFSFFEDAGNLEKITPGFLHFRIATPLPIEMKEGTLIDYRLRLFGMPIKWRTLIETYEPPVRFVDMQLKGPYKVWHHTHEFEEVDEGTRMTDTVQYSLRFGPLGLVARSVFVKRTLGQIFDYRQQCIDEMLG